MINADQSIAFYGTGLCADRFAAVVGGYGADQGVLNDFMSCIQVQDSRILCPQFVPSAGAFSSCLAALSRARWCCTTTFCKKSSRCRARFKSPGNSLHNLLCWLAG